MSESSAILFNMSESPVIFLNLPLFPSICSKTIFLYGIDLKKLSLHYFSGFLRYRSLFLLYLLRVVFSPASLVLRNFFGFFRSRSEEIPKKIRRDSEARPNKTITQPEANPNTVQTMIHCISVFRFLQRKILSRSKIFEKNAE
jgi:hypothetical protein